MSSFTESGLVKKLSELNPSQQSIQTLSLWLIHHRKHHSIIVKTWLKELHRVSSSKKLTFMYLANDVIQNSKKKGPEFGKEYENVLLKAFKLIAGSGPEEKTIHSLNRILNIWGERGVYDEPKIKEYSAALNQREKSPAAAATATAATPSKKNGEEKREKRKQEGGDSNGHGHKKKSKSSSSSSSSSATANSGSSAAPVEKKPVKSEVTIEVNGKVETHVTLSPHQPDGDPPEPEELIRVIQELENSASSDAAVRERIANLPPEVSELSALAKLEDKEAAMRLAVKVNDAIKILNDYNARLASEMDDRKKLTTMLKDFQREQQELLAQAEQRLEEYTSKLSKIKEVQREVRNHMNNLPDLTALPDVTGGLAPLPSAGDLFNIHHH
ncbi:regulation of nuclear pre-mRNA domain-containing protein 1B [Culex quinquefasciatus]|uniref:regulation of nuclear pre-mRNA domain-containing protein 1B n=1 Tax=Culex quinquefasciatus TaxID=7176 RepID=UPI0018E30342|nr:regulation of nuclear pre-mRNA domain-containing protein 1B [Culex quinquefasciatus]